RTICISASAKTKSSKITVRSPSTNHRRTDPKAEMLRKLYLHITGSAASSTSQPGASKAMRKLGMWHERLKASGFLRILNSVVTFPLFPRDYFRYLAREFDLWRRAPAPKG